MELPKPADLTTKEKNACVQVSPKDSSHYPEFFYWPFEQLLRFSSAMPVPGSKEAAIKFGASNWEPRYHGYYDWAVPRLEDEDTMEGMMRVMNTQMIYNRFGNEDLDYPEIQLKKLFAAPIERSLAIHSKSAEHKELQQKIFVMKYSLSPFASSYHEDFEDRCGDKSVRVWRLIACYGETNLDTLHDRILGPTMGWARHYHSYRFVVPTTGACFGPKSSGAIDAMHAMTQQMYTLDSEKYQLCHVLRKSGQRLVYVYDLGDNWVHNIELIQVADKGDTLEIPLDEQMKKSLRKQFGSDLPKLFGAQLLAGQLNCPPEDSKGCNKMGLYGNILRKGPKFQSCEAARSVNWEQHHIRNAYDFDLAAHSKRLTQAIAGKSSSKYGQKTFYVPLTPFANDPAAKRMIHACEPGERLKERCMGNMISGCNPMSETVRTRPDKASEAVCGTCGRQPSIDAGKKTPLLRCSGCKGAWYCGQDCQVADWENHKRRCRLMKKERMLYKKEMKENKKL